MLIPSTLDDTLAPKGAHVASLFCQHVAPELPTGESWDDFRDEVGDLMIATVDHYAPGFKQSVIGRQVLTPLDLEREFGLLGGDIFHGALTLNQLFSARPMLGHADYRSPIKGLYHCGALFGRRIAHIGAQREHESEHDSDLLHLTSPRCCWRGHARARRLMRGSTAPPIQSRGESAMNLRGR